MKFCSQCGAEAIELRVPEGDTLPRFVCGNCGQWARPHTTAFRIDWDCPNDCAVRGLAIHHYMLR